MSSFARPKRKRDKKIPFKRKEGDIISKDKYLSKNDFWYDTSPNVRRSDGKGHVVYRTAVHKKKSKINVITHSNSFFDESTHSLTRNWFYI